jgi:hypothetical protein
MALYTKLLLFVVYNSGKQAKTVENENIDKCLLWNEKGNVVEAPEIKKAGHKSRLLVVSVLNHEGQEGYSAFLPAFPAGLGYVGGRMPGSCLA